ncbi:MAG: flagellar hook capping FlgD N-terminal domain-containing protein [Pseudomonadota bacterium]|nr:flagellar hook capping FlgD N-terminal domain-containing protein [Pseudomonadota bacterium]MEE3099536.1 flagellar hook capping FlgD N-terminal domain-containing protein [Pseudomonadota bacterium]
MTLDATSLAATGASAGGASGTAAAGARQDSAEDALATAAGDFETFLTLLTTQMRNQDPLKPLESTEFVAQLAAFSAVEQQIRSNDRLDAIFTLMSEGGEAGLAQWIGKEVQAEARARFDGEEIAMETMPLAGAKRAVLMVSDAAGEPVARIEVDPAATDIVWDGRTANGAAPDGLYGFEVAYFSADESLGSSPGLIRDRVTEIRLGGEAPALRLAGGDEIAASAVVTLRGLEDA